MLEADGNYTTLLTVVYSQVSLSRNMGAGAAFTF
jgi:hypothetical protein